MDIDRLALEEWQKNQPLAILQLDPSDRVVLRVAGKKQLLLVLCYDYPGSLSVSQCMRVFFVNKQKKLMMKLIMLLERIKYFMYRESRFSLKTNDDDTHHHFTVHFKINRITKCRPLLSQI